MNSQMGSFLRASIISFALVSQTLTVTNAAPKIAALDAATNELQNDGAAAELAQGQSLLRRGRAAEALPHLTNALNAAKQNNQPRVEGGAQAALGELYERQGQYAVALTHYTEAQRIFAELASRSSSATLPGGAQFSSGADAYNANLMYARIGAMYERQGDIAAARRAFSQMRAEKPESGAVEQTKKGRSFIDRAKNTLQSVGSGRPTLSSLENAPNNTASIIKDRTEAFQNTIAFASQQIGLGRADFRVDDLGSARKHFQDAFDATRGDLPFIGGLYQAQRFRAAAKTGLGDVALRQGKYDEAVKDFREAISEAQKDKRPELAWSAQRGLARSLWKQAATTRDAARASSLRDESIAAYRDAIKTIETLRVGSVRADEARTTFLATTKDVYDEASSALAELALMNAGTDSSQSLNGKALEYAGEALSVGEQGRARALLDMLAESNAQITEGVPADLLKRKQENLANQQDIADRMTGVSLAADAQKRDPKQLDEELNQLQTEYDAIENQIRTSSPRYASLTATAPLSFDAIRGQTLDAQTALVEYRLGKDASYLWVVTQTGVNLFKLPARDSVAAQVVAVRDAILPEKARRSFVVPEGDSQRGLGLSDAPIPNDKVAQFADAANALYKTILAPAEPLIKDKRLLIVADGALNYVPFECLVTQAAGGANDYSALNYLIKTNEIVYAPSASVVAAIRAQSKPSNDAGKGLLVIADPVFDARDPRAQKAGGAQANEASAEMSRELSLGAAVADVAGEGKNDLQATAQTKWTLARLTGTRTEAQQIAQLARAANLKADQWLDLDANEQNVESRDISNYRIIHIATHGLLDTEHPQFSGVVLSLVGNRNADGFLRADEIYNLRLGHPLVMLSACQTGLGKERRGEGVVGLTRAFLYAGASTVGVTLWSVADKSTADLMTDFYRRMLARQNAAPPAAALRAAQLAMIAGKRYSAPFYWSPFVLVGDWRS